MREYCFYRNFKRDLMEFIWLSLSDPRFGRNSDHWNGKDKLNHIEENLVLEVQKLAVDVVEKRNNIIKIIVIDQGVRRRVHTFYDSLHSIVQF